MFLVILLALLGIASSFIVKFLKKTDKKSKLDFWFWVKDNFMEVILSLISMTILLIIAVKTEFDNTIIGENIPFIKSLPIGLIAAAIIGYLNNTLWYWVVKKAKKKIGM